MAHSNKPQPNWQEKVLDIKKLNNNGIPLKEAVKLHKWTIAMYRNYHKRLNLPRSKECGRTYSTNINYFESIDTEYKAYFLGFIYADGCIHTPSSNRSSKVLSIKIQEQDSYILDKLAMEITPDKKPRTVIEYNTFSLKMCNRTVYAVNSDKIYTDLYNLGVRERKSTEGMEFPNLSKEMYRHFVRGFLDGNGYISNVSNPTPVIGFCSTNNSFLLKIAELLPLNYGNGVKNKRAVPVHYLTYGSKLSVEYLKEYLYKDSNIYLTRKFNKLN